MTALFQRRRRRRPSLVVIHPQHARRGPATQCGLGRTVEYERDRRLAWEPTHIAYSLPEDQQWVGTHFGQRWTYTLEPIDSKTTLVKEIYTIDCDKMPEFLRTLLNDGEHFLEFMAKTLENLEQQVTSPQQ